MQDLKTSERREEILKRLCRRRHDTIKSLSQEFGVSERTIQRDIDVLSRLNYPVYTLPGRHGGVYVVDNYYMDRMYFQPEQLEIMKKLLIFAQNEEKCKLSDSEIHILQHLIKEYTKPSIPPKREESTV